jgi:hypothetical protein
MNANDISLTQIDELGLLLAQIAELTTKAEKIKDGIKDSASKGGPKVIEGNLFKATYSESNRTVFDKEKFVKAFGESEYAKYTKVSASFSVKTTAR